MADVYGSGWIAHLPASLTPIVGREAELTEAFELLRSPNVRLLTVTGPGGVGKTRLAIELATRACGSIVEDVRLIRLAGVVAPEDVLRVVAQAVGVSDAGSPQRLDAVAATLRDRSMLLLLDNFEHVIGARTVVVHLLESAPLVKVLVTSRSALRILGESEFILGPLAFPQTADGLTVTDVPRYPALRLFTDRVHAYRRDFAVNDRNISTIAQICARLDGLPLAMELAAPHLRLASPEGVLAQMERFSSNPFLSPTNLPRRHQTLQASTKWSLDLLTEPARAYFRRLCIFRRTFSAEVAWAVAGDWPDPTPLRDSDGAVVEAVHRGAEAFRARTQTPIEATEVLLHLLDQNLIHRFSPGTDDPRFSLLETIRAVGLEELDAEGEMDIAAARHAGYVLALLEEAEIELTGRDQTRWLTRLDAEIIDIRAGLRWAVANLQLDIAARMAAAAWRFWWIRGHISEGREWLKRALALDGSLPPALHARVHGAIGRLARQQSDFDEAEAHHLRAISFWNQASETTTEVATCLNDLGVSADDRGDHGQACEWFNLALDIHRAHGDRRAVALLLTNLGYSHFRQGDLAKAMTHLDEALSRWRQLQDDWGMTMAQCAFGDVRLARSEFTTAIAIFRQTLGICLRQGNQRYTMECFRGISEVAGGMGQHVVAAQLAGAAHAIRGRLRLPRPPADERRQRATIERMRDAIGAAAFDEAFGTGEQLQMEDAAALAMHVGEIVQTPATSTSGDPVPASALTVGVEIPTKREQEVLALIAKGQTDPEIARSLFVSTHTATTHAKNIRRKLNLGSRSAMAAYAVRQGIDDG